MSTDAHNQMQKDETTAHNAVPCDTGAITAPQVQMRHYPYQGEEESFYERAINLAISKGDLTIVEKMMDLKDRNDAKVAKQAYDAAMNEFKKDPPQVIKNRKVSFTTTSGTTEYMHATLDNVCDQITQTAGNFGLSHRWEVEQPDKSLVRVTCVITHSLGHSERTTMAAGPDDSGRKNPIQAVASTVHYLQRYTLLSGYGMAESNADDDAQSAGPKLGKLSEYLESMSTAPNLKILYETFKAAFKEATDLSDVYSLQQLNAAKDKRKKQLEAEA